MITNSNFYIYSPKIIESGVKYQKLEIIILTIISLNLKGNGGM